MMKNVLLGTITDEKLYMEPRSILYGIVEYGSKVSMVDAIDHRVEDTHNAALFHKS